MSIPVTPAFLDTIKSSHRRSLSASVLTPGSSDPISIDISGGSIAASLGTGTKYSGTIDVTPDDTRDWASLLTIPGSIFDVQVGVYTDPDTVETVQLLSGELAAAPDVDFYGNAFTLSIADQWTRLSRCRYVDPFTSPADTRANIISSRVTEAIPGVTVVVVDSGGSHNGDVTWDKDRVQTIADLAGEGELEGGFNASGEFIIRTVPQIVLSDAWEVEDGDFGTLLAALRSQPIDRLYNTVVVRPALETQSWDQQVVAITDASSPRHESKIGIVPFFLASPTIETAPEAVSAGQGVLRGLLQQTQTVKITLVDNPALEPGDTVSFATQGNTPIVTLCTGINRNLAEATMDLDLMIGADTVIEEAA